MKTEYLQIIFQKKRFFLVENFFLILMEYLITLYISRYLSNFNYQFYKVPILVKKKISKKNLFDFIWNKNRTEWPWKKKIFFSEISKNSLSNGISNDRVVFRTIERRGTHALSDRPHVRNFFFDGPMFKSHIFSIFAKPICISELSWSFRLQCIFDGENIYIPDQFYDEEIF